MHHFSTLTNVGWKLHAQPMYEEVEDTKRQICKGVEEN